MKNKCAALVHHESQNQRRRRAQQWIDENGWSAILEAIVEAEEDTTGYIARSYFKGSAMDLDFAIREAVLKHALRVTKF